MKSTLQVRVNAITVEAEGILALDLRPFDLASDLPAFTAGAHIDLCLPTGLVRSYSLLNNPCETHRYVVAINKDPKSRGGSKYIHESLREGDVLTIHAPCNHFQLNEGAARSVFIAGGIGITPLWSMIQHLESRNAAWELHYAARSRARCAFFEELNASGNERVNFYFEDQASPGLLDLEKLIRGIDADADIYCCGPASMLDAFVEACRDRKPETVHFEYFASATPPNIDGGFVVELARSGRSIEVDEGTTILDALLDAGVPAPYSCREGICGCCEIKVLEGVPDHRDRLLSEAERASNSSIFICCSGCKTPRLVLDL